MTVVADDVRLTRPEIKTALVSAGGGLLAVLDTTIVVVALPQFMSAFDAPLTAVQWIGTSYLIGTVATMPLAAAAANRFGARRSLITALGAFTATSVAAGLAPDLGWLIAIRAAQGMAGGLVVPLGVMLAFAATAPHRRARITSVTGLPLLIGPILGPVLGGLLVDQFSWRALFFVTVPPALLALVGAVRWIPGDRRPSAPLRVDLVGAALLVPGVVAVALGLTAESSPGWSRAASSVGGLVLIAVFARRAWSRSDAIVRLSLLLDRVFGAGAAVLALYAAPYFGSMLLLPAYIQVVRSDSALVTALLTMPSAVAMGATVQVSARVVERYGTRVVVGTGLSVSILATGLLAALLEVDTPYAVIAVCTALLGAGTGAVMLPTIAGSNRDLHGADLTSGATLLQVIPTLANVVGTAAVSALFAGFIAALTGGALDDRRHGDPSWLAGIVDAHRLTLVVTLGLMAAALYVRLRTAPTSTVGRA